MSEPSTVERRTLAELARPSSGLKRTTKQKLTRGSLYSVFVVVIVLAAFLADWGAIQRSFLNPDIAREMFPRILTIAARNTVIFTITSFSLGLLLGLLLALMKLSTIRPYRWFSNIYIEIFRGLPALLTVLLVGFAIPIAFEGFRWRDCSVVPGCGTYGAGTVGLGLVAAAYMAETIRAGIEAVPKGQMEAARSLGMSRGWALLSIIIPQAFRIIIPPLTNELILLIKDTSLLFVLGTSDATKELTKFGRDFANLKFNGTPYIVVGLVYLMITIPMTRVVARLEARNKKAR